MNLSTINKGLFTAFTCLLTATVAAQLKIAEAGSNNVVLPQVYKLNTFLPVQATAIKNYSVVSKT